MEHNDNKPDAGRSGGKRRPVSLFRRLLQIAVILLFAAILLILSVPWFVPVMVEWKINEILKDMTEKGDGTPSLEFREIGLFHTSLAVDFKRKSRPDSLCRRFTEDDFGIASFSIDYKPCDLLFRSKIDSVRIEGVRVPLQIYGRTAVFPLWEKVKIDLTPSSSSGGGKPFTGFNFRLDTLPVKVGSIHASGTILLQMLEKENGPVLDAILLPLEFGFVSHEDDANVLDWRVKLQGSANGIAASGVFDLVKARVAGNAKIRLDTALTPHTLRSLLKEERNRANLMSDLAFDLDLKDPMAGTASGSLRGRVQAFLTDTENVLWEPDLDFSLSGKKLSVKTGHLRVRGAGEEISFPEATCLFYLDHLMGEGKIRAVSGRGPEINVQYDIQPSPKGDSWRLHLTSEDAGGTERNVLSAQQGDCRISLASPEFDARADFRTPIAFGASAMIPNVQLLQSGWSLNLDDIALASEGDLAAFGATLRTGKLDFRYGPEKNIARASFPGLFLNVRKTKDEEGLLLSFEADDGQCLLPDHKVLMKGISFHQKLSLKTDKTGRGVFRIDDIRLDEKTLGNFQAETDLQNDKFQAGGPLTLCGVRADCRAEVGFGHGFAASFGLDIPSQPIPGEALAELFPGPVGDKKISGNVEVKGEYAISGGRQSGSARVRLTNGAVSSESMKLSAEGIRGEVLFPNLPEIRTAPNQPLFCRSIRFGNMTMDGAILRYRLDSPQSICAERMTLNWCGGKVRMECTYFEPGSNSLSVTVHCDRLDLIQFLTQTGAGTGEGNGNGRISGTLPVSFDRKTRKLSVRNAFLYSTPGEEGKIQFVLDESIRNAQEKSVTFDMTQDALRNFEYSWAKVQMGTEGGSLKLQLQLDGKPAAPLYYTYGGNGIVKSNVPHVFQGIRLDVNLNLPLDVLFDLMDDFNLLKN